MKTSKNKKGFFALKLDLSKAFDSVEWAFVEKNFFAFGFNKDWCRLIMQCVTTTSFSVLLNGIPGETFTVDRGLRQGDPLSPYLFIVCMEFLSRLLVKAEKDNKITGIKVSKSAPPISHLFFVDECFPFSKAGIHEARNIMDIINIVGEISGQMQCLAFPKTTLDNVEKMQRELWWNKKDDAKGIYTKSWKDIAKIVFILWSIWNHGNDVVFNYITPDLVQLVSRIQKDFVSIPRTKPAKVTKTFQQNLSMMEEDSFEWVVKFDASFKVDDFSMGFVVSINNVSGSYSEHRAGSGWASNPLDAEAKAFLHALQWVKDMKIESYFFLNDCKNL
ncbi:uncharacterized protein LOC113353984 [Papaver somniferum]|uniref:uncharacterized protein LOC113353984 n=1 Tax=Papaver somniferum TaxID=3469 RepID=UPI000E6FC90A|nr:uncharacterized protein LOC113353984 [Papaver somniferum]